MDRIPRPGEFYRHFKNRIYQILHIAAHTETGERLVIYQALYGDFGIYARPLEQFMSPVDREKYPQVRQKDRFERIVPGRQGQETEDVSESRERLSEAPQEDTAVPQEDTAVPQEDTAVPQEDVIREEASMSPLLVEFLDLESYEERLAVLRQMKGKVGQREVDSLCLALDITGRTGNVEEQLESLIQYLKMQQRYDASRLRRR